MRSRSYEVFFRSEDLNLPTILVGRYEVSSVAEKIAKVLQLCATEGTAFVVHNDKALPLS
jgi:hypothetical protein